MKRSLLSFMLCSLGGASVLFAVNAVIRQAQNIAIGGSAPSYPLDIRVTGSGVGQSQVHFGPDTVDDGAWLFSFVPSGNPFTAWSAGSYFNGAAWVAKNATAMNLTLDNSGSLTMAYDTGLTPGNTFTPSPKIEVTKSGHIVGRGAAPALSACGGSPAITGTDISGTVTAGSAATGCVVTFAVAYGGTPHCAVSSEAAIGLSYSASTTALTVVAVSLTGNFDYVCIQ